MKSSSYFVTGIGTDVGKTIASAILCNVLELDYWKPVQTGDFDQHDRHVVSKYQNDPKFKIFEESYAFNQPLSPHIAAELDDRKIEFTEITLPESKRGLIVEGAGGILVPLDWGGRTNLDLVKSLGLSVILVSRHYLGSINHTLLSIEIMKQHNISIHGIVYVGEEIQGTKKIIEHISKIPTLLEIPIFQNLSEKNVIDYIDIHRENIKKAF